MTVARGFAITVASGIGFAAIGGLLGYLMGILVPDYFHVMFHITPGTEFDPTQVGLGLGLTEGLAGGLLVGLVIVVVVAWYNSRTNNRST